eukprot:CAMPEP_0206623586 /NCGR_PEP_ID=MMETSP0325_2-20121206/63566_1 /ASSEMBLY_ACC=CAM_ASM_000347 /TAXON_ID=2866 /ORGANISM="Crypthecodinium cohnii, Strain Seligo" /LENGTH=49 /DNA_ID= /DNA_START= /DNA_END= /DNA_ORIENTATION=
MGSKVGLQATSAMAQRRKDGRLGLAAPNVRQLPGPCHNKEPWLMQCGEH